MVNILADLEKIFLSSPLLGLGVSFAAGIISSFSPCIYPLIPITLSIVGASAATSRVKGFYISSVFVLGLCVTYTVLGITASVLGIFLGTLFVNPFIYLMLGIFFVFLGFCVFDIIKLNLPFFSQDYKPVTTVFSIFVLGVISGLAIVPCNFPVLGAILSFMAVKHDILYGGFSLFLFSLGYGSILIILGTFSSLITKLPKQGLWLIIIKKVLGIILLVIGIYFFSKSFNLLR